MERQTTGTGRLVYVTVRNLWQKTSTIRDYPTSRCRLCSKTRLAVKTKRIKKGRKRSYKGWVDWTRTNHVAPIYVPGTMKYYRSTSSCFLLYSSSLEFFMEWGRDDPQWKKKEKKSLSCRAVRRRLSGRTKTKTRMADWCHRHCHVVLLAVVIVWSRKFLEIRISESFCNN